MSYPNNRMTTVAHPPVAPVFKRDSWSLSCPASTSTVSISSECPFINPSISTSSSRRLPPGHPPVDLPRNVPSSDDRIGASNILPTLPPLPSSDSTEIIKGNFAHLFSEDLDLPSAALQHALKGFRAADEGYATESYDSAFNWDDLVSSIFLFSCHPTDHLSSSCPVL